MPFGPEISWPYGFRQLDSESREVLESAYDTGPVYSQPAVDDYGYGDPGYADPSYDGPRTPYNGPASGSTASGGPASGSTAFGGPASGSTRSAVSAAVPRMLRRHGLREDPATGHPRPACPGTTSPRSAIRHGPGPRAPATSRRATCRHPAARRSGR